MLRLLALCLVLGGCAQPATYAQPAAIAEPNRVLLYPAGLNVLMSDGTLCAGHRPGRARDWTGQLSGCPHLLPYEVRGSDPRTPRLELPRGDPATNPSVSVAGVTFAAR
ncbi:MAG: hypothetical protein WBN04_21080 [Paracoccaceae bacterium]